MGAPPERKRSYFNGQWLRGRRPVALSLIFFFQFSLFSGILNKVATRAVMVVNEKSGGETAVKR